MNRLLVDNTARFLCCALLLAGCTNDDVREATARVEVDPQASFGTVFVGTAAEATFRILSTGSAPVRIVSVHAPGLEIVGTPEGPLAGGSARVVTLRWGPATPGRIDATAELEIEAETLREFSVGITGEAIARPSCDDGNPCTDGAFDDMLGRCVFTPREGACDDANACTEGDRCAQGVCVGVAVTCDDDDVCTRDVCEPATGCVFLPDETICDDGDPCTRDVCEGEGRCSHPPVPDQTLCGPMTCAAFNVCVSGECRSLDITGHSDGEACDDGDRCTTEDECQAGECVGVFTPRGPELLKELPVVGGPEALVGTDGVHLLVHDQGLLHVATRNAEGRFRFRSTTGMAMSTSPVALATGRFVAGDHEALLVIDVTRPDAPVITRHVIAESWRILRLRPVAGGLLVHRVAPDEALLHLALDTNGRPGKVTTLWNGRLLDFDVAGEQLVYTDGNGVWWALIDLSTGSGPRLVRRAHLSKRRAQVATDGARVALFDGILNVGRVVQVPADDPVACDGQGPCRQLGPACESPDAFEAGPWRLCGSDGSCPSGASCLERPVDICPACEDCEANLTTVWLCVMKQRTVFEPTFEALAGHTFPTAPEVALSTDGSVWTSEGGRVRRYSADGALEAFVPPVNTGIEVVGGLVLLSGGERLRVLERKDGGYIDVAPDGLGAFNQVVPGAAGTALLGGSHAVAELDLERGRLSSWHSTLNNETPACRQLLAGPSGYATTVDAWPEDPPGCDVTRVDTFHADGHRRPLHPEELDGGTTLVTGRLLWRLGSSLRIWRLDDFDPSPVHTEQLNEDITSLSADHAGERALVLEHPWNGVSPVAHVLAPPWHSPNTSGSFTLEGTTEYVTSLMLAEESLLGSTARSVLLWQLGDPQPAARLELDGVFGPPQWMLPTRAWGSIHDDENGYSVAELSHDASAGRLELLGEVPLPGRPRALRPVHDAVVVVHDRGASILAPACE